MFDFILNTDALTLNEKLAIGGEVSLLGLGAVFAVLIIVWGIVEVLHLALSGPEKKTEAPAATRASSEVVTSSEVLTAPEPIANTATDLDIIAVITAAIAAASGQSPSSFRVVSFRRANNKFSYRK